MPALVMCAALDMCSVSVDHRWHDEIADEISTPESTPKPRVNGYFPTPLRVYVQSATLAAGPESEASGNLVGPVKN